MPKRGKRYLKAVELVDRTKSYSPEEAIDLVKKTATAKFDESVDVAVLLGVDPRHADQQVRGSVVLPHGTGKKVRVLVFAQGEKAKEAQEAGADYVGGEELVKKIQSGWLDFDAVISTPDMMRVVSRLGRILGPRGLMPSSKTGTVTFEVKRAVEEFKKGKINFKTDRYGNIHAMIGKVSFESEHLLRNLAAFLDALIRAKPPAAKGQYIRKVVLSSTMGPGVKVDVNQIPAFIKRYMAE